MITTNNHMTYREPTPQDRQSLIDVLEAQGYQYHENKDYRDLSALGPFKNFFVYFEHSRLVIVHHDCECCRFMFDESHTKKVLTDILVTLGKLDIEAIYHVQQGWSDRLYVYIPENMVNKEATQQGYDFHEIDQVLMEEIGKFDQDDQHKVSPLTRKRIEDWLRKTATFGEPLA